MIMIAGATPRRPRREGLILIRCSVWGCGDFVHVARRGFVDDFCFGLPMLCCNVS
jgi:hypothetical protein